MSNPKQPKVDLTRPSTKIDPEPPQADIVISDNTDAAAEQPKAEVRVEREERDGGVILETYY